MNEPTKLTHDEILSRLRQVQSALEHATRLSCECMEVSNGEACVPCKANDAITIINTLILSKEVELGYKTELSLLSVLADIRQKTGVGDKVMLSELADTLAALVQNGQSAIDANMRLMKALHRP